MTEVIWTADAERFLLELDIATAERILEAVERMARTGRGFVRDMLDGRGTRGLYVGEFVVLFVIAGSEVVRIQSVQSRRGGSIT